MFVSCRFFDSVQEGLAILTVKNINKKAEGIFQLKAKNEAGTATGQINVTVHCKLPICIHSTPLITIARVRRF